MAEDTGLGTGEAQEEQNEDRQNLDDMTVLQDVRTQDLGAEENIGANAEDVNEQANAATIQMGSDRGRTEDGFTDAINAISGGIVDGLDVAREPASGGLPGIPEDQATTSAPRTRGENQNTPSEAASDNRPEETGAGPVADPNATPGAASTTLDETRDAASPEADEPAANAGTLAQGPETNATPFIPEPVVTVNATTTQTTTAAEENTASDVTTDSETTGNEPENATADAQNAADEARADSNANNVPDQTPPQNLAQNETGSAPAAAPAPEPASASEPTISPASEPVAAATPEPAAATPEPAAATPEPAAATPEPAAATPEPTTPASEPETAPAPEPASDDTAASPLLEVTDVSGTEDTAIDLNLSAALTDTDGSESLTITLSGVPEGAELSSGIDNGNGTWTLEAGDLDHLTLTPPANSDADFTLSVMITSTESNGGASTSVTGSIHVDVAPDADPPMLVVHDASGTEDTPISLDILASLADTDGSESLSITLSGLPEGAELSAGTHNADGSWTLSADDLEGLHVTPPHDSDADFTLSVTATSTDGNDTSVVSGTINVSVAPDADPPTLTLQDAQGFEDQPIPLNIHFELHDIDGSETLAGNIVISNIPEGATLNLGEAGPDNTWIISQEDLAVTGTNAQGDPISWEIPGLTMTPPEHGDSDFSLGVAITIRDGDDVHTETGQFNIDLTAVADHADIDATRATGTEDTAIPLDIHFALQDQDGSESLSGNIVLTNIPEGAHLNVGEAGPGNTWVISQEDLHVVAHNDQGHPVAWEVPDLTITPPNNSDQDFNLGIRIVTMEGNEARVTNGEIDVIVNPDADEVVFSTSSKPTKVHPDSDEQKEGGSKGGGSKSGGSKDGGSKGGGSKDGGSKGGGSKDGGSKDGGSKDGGSKGGGSKSGGSKDGGSKSGGSKSGGSKGGGSKSGEGTVGDDNGNEVELDISFALGDQDGSESLSGNIVLTDVPEGATFNIGQAGPDHSWELPLSSLAQTAFNDHGTPVAWNIPGLKISVPDGVDDNFDLGIRITTLDGNDTQVTEGHIGVDVYADNEAENPLEEPMDGKSIGGGSKDGGSKGGGSKDGGSKGGGSKDGGSKGGGSKDGGSKGGGSKDGGSKGGGSKGGESDSDGQVITVGHGDDVLELTVAHQGNGTDCRFEVYIDGQPIEGGPFSSDAVHSQGEWETIRFEGIDLGDGERVITIESVDDGGNQVLVDKIAINGEEIQAENGATWDNGDANVLGGDAVHVHQGEEIQFQVDINDEADQDPPQAQEEPEDQEEPQAQGNDDAPVADLNLAGGSGDDVLTGDAGNDTITGGAGDDVLGGESGNDTLMGGEGNDLFIFGTGDGVDYVDGGSGDGWLDAIHLENVSGGPGDNIENAGDWTLDSDSAFTMDGDGSIVFDDPNASGTVTLEDGSTIEFTNIDQIQW